MEYGYRKFSSREMAIYLVDDTLELPLKKDEIEYLLSNYPYSKELDVFVDNGYTHPDAWAHTIPKEGKIWIRSPEFIAYELGFNRVLGHELGHNVRHSYGLPDGDEDHHTRNAFHHLAYSGFRLRSASDLIRY